MSERYTNYSHMPPSQTPAEPTSIYQKRKPSVLVELLKYTIVAFIIIVPVRLFVAQPFVVSGESMSPTFNPGDYLVIDKLAYAHSSPQRGDIIVFRYPLDPSLFYIKRVVGLPGETVELNNGVISIIEGDGQRHIFNGSHLAYDPSVQTPLVTTLASDEYYVLGDNRDASSDSRDWGPLQMKFIVGRALVRVLPLSNAGFLPGYEASSTVE
jgi:signal peptidase I